MQTSLQKTVVETHFFPLDDFNSWETPLLQIDHIQNTCDLLK